MEKRKQHEAPMVDSHCHVDLYPNPRDLVSRVETAGIYTVAVTNAPSVFRHTAELTKGKNFVRPGLGLHPELAVERASELRLMWQYLSKTRYVGEVGLDYTTTKNSERAKQRAVFEDIVSRCHESADKILTVHSRRAADDVMNTFGNEFRGAVILHWYTGSKRVLEKAISRGFYFSINTTMANSEKSLQMFDYIPRELLLTETDGPFVSNARAPAQPQDVSSVISALARRWKWSEQEVRQLLYENFTRLLQTGRNSPTSPRTQIDDLSNDLTY